MVAILIQYQTHETGFLSVENGDTEDFFPISKPVLPEWVLLRASFSKYLQRSLQDLTKQYWPPHVWNPPISTITYFWAKRRHVTFWKCNMTPRFCRRISLVYCVLPLRGCWEYFLLHSVIWAHILFFSTLYEDVMKLASRGIKITNTYLTGVGIRWKG